LGSYCALTDLNKKVVQRNYFDPWGNFKWVYKGRGDEFEMTDSLQRDTISMQPISTANFTVSSRGFTGHEHYPQFKIINMNGRLYDPVIARFFSPDKYVMNSSFTQDFNRYTYARNNPLKYTDPSGDYIWIIGLMQTMEAIFNAFNISMFDDLNKTLGADGRKYSPDNPLFISAGSLYGGMLEPVTITAPSPGSEFRTIMSDFPGRFISGSPTINRPQFNGVPVQPVDNTANNYRPYALPPPPIAGGIDKPEDMGGLNLPKIPVNDNLLKKLDYTATVLEGLREYSKHVNYAPLKNGSKYVPYISLPINAALTYNSFADFVSKPSLEHGYRFAKSAGSFTFLGGAISYMADTYERGTVWFANWLTKFEKHLQSNEFWLDLYGY